MASHNIFSAIGGSVALCVWAQPRTTKDADINIGLPLDGYQRLKELFLGAGHEVSDLLGPYSGLKGIRPPYDEEKLYSFVVTYKGLNMDMYLNTCKATEWAITSAVKVNDYYYIQAECLAYFKLFGMRRKYGRRYHQDVADVLSLLSRPNFKNDLVLERLCRVFGPDSPQVMIFNQLLQENEDAKD